jgi:hypothetical protein
VSVGVAVVGDELDVRSALSHATDKGEVTAYGPQSSRWGYVVIAAVDYEHSSRRTLPVDGGSKIAARPKGAQK